MRSNGPGRSSSSLLAREATAEIVRNLVEGGELYARMFGDIVVDALQHQQDLRPSGNVRMNGHGEHGVVVFAVDPIELIAPQLFDVARLDEAVTVGGILNEDHRRQGVQIPASGADGQIGLFTAYQRLHPLAGA